MNQNDTEMINNTGAASGLNAAAGSVFVVILEDRHIDVDVEIWTDKDAAINRARELAKENCRHDDDYEEEEIADWLFFARYSCEDDSCRVVERPILSPNTRIAHPKD